MSLQQSCGDISQTWKHDIEWLMCVLTMMKNVENNGMEEICLVTQVYCGTSGTIGSYKGSCETFQKCLRDLNCHIWMKNTHLSVYGYLKHPKEPSHDLNKWSSPMRYMLPGRKELNPFNKCGYCGHLCYLLFYWMQMGWENPTLATIVRYILIEVIRSMLMKLSSRLSIRYQVFQVY